MSCDFDNMSVNVQHSYYWRRGGNLKSPTVDIEDQTVGTGQIDGRHFTDGYLAENKPNPMSAVWNRSRMEPFSFGAYRPLTSLICRTLRLQVLEKNGGDDGTRTRGLCRDSLARIGFTTTYNNAGTAKIPASRTRHIEVWVELWVGKPL
jgi:hypothetical protein